MDTEKKSIITQIIQYYVKAIQGILVFCNKDDKTAVKKAKDLFSSLAFNTKLSNQLKTEIVDPVEQPYASPKNNSEIKFVKHLFQTKFGLHEDKVLDDSKKKSEIC